MAFRLQNSCRPEATLSTYSRIYLSLIIWRGTPRRMKPSTVVIRWGGFKRNCFLKPDKSMCSPLKCIKGECRNLQNVYHNAKASHRYLQVLLRKELSDFPNDRFPRIEGLCFEAISKFSSMSLRSYGHCLGPGAIVPPVEAQYRNEFYRACYVILNYNVYLTSEWSASPIAGRADFHIRSVGWTIECVREGDRLEEHIARFKNGGKYHGAITSGQTKQYILLDFRTSMPKKARGRVLYTFIIPSRTLLTSPKDIPFLYHVVFSGNFTEYTVYKANLDKKLARVTLLEK